MFVKAVVSIQGVLLFTIVLLALLITTTAAMPATFTQHPIITRAMAWVRRSFSLSRRGLAWFRVACGFAVLIDIVLRSTEIDVWNWDNGLMSRERKLQLCSRVQSSWTSTCNWSVHMATGSHTGHVTFFFIHSALAIALIIGWKARETALALYLLTVSLQNFDFSHRGVGDIYLKYSLFWAWQLPIGRKSNGERKQRKDAENMMFTTETASFVLTICIIYWSCVVSRMEDPTQSAWLDGTALYRAITMSRFRTANYYRLHLPDISMTVFRIGTWGALLLEAVCPFLLLSYGKSRNIAVACFASLFFGIYVLIALGHHPILCSTTLFPFLFSYTPGNDGNIIVEEKAVVVPKKKITRGATTRTKSKGRTTSTNNISNITKTRSGGRERTKMKTKLLRQSLQDSAVKPLLKSVLSVFAVLSLWIDVTTCICYSSATIAAAVPGCAAAQSILPTVWETPFASHGPWEMFSSFEMYRDWRVLQMMSNITAEIDPLEHCRQRKQQHDVYTCLLAIGQQEKLVSLVPHAPNKVAGALSDHIKSTAQVPARDSLGSFSWQAFWETMYFKEGGMEEAYSAVAAFHCRRSGSISATASATSDGRVVPRQRFYLLLMVQQGEATSKFCYVTLVTCECGKCKPKYEGGDHSIVHVSNVPLREMNLPLSQYLLGKSSAVPKQQRWYML